MQKPLPEAQIGQVGEIPLSLLSLPGVGSESRSIYC